MVRASLGHKGGAFALRANDNNSTATKSTYPMYGLKISDLLELNEWVPHQDLLAQGKLHVIGEAERKRVLFLSHQWCSFLHPDPKAEQLKALKIILKRLVEGEISVRSHPALEMGYDYKRIDGPKEWRALLEDGYIWHDYTCIPQPLAYKAKLEGCDAASDNEQRPHAGMVGSDHRSGDCGDDQVMAMLVDNLKKAVDSIPSYVERAEMVWILVPPVAHEDVPNVRMPPAKCHLPSTPAQHPCPAPATCPAHATCHLPSTRHLPPAQHTPPAPAQHSPD